MATHLCVLSCEEQTRLLRRSSNAPIHRRWRRSTLLLLSLLLLLLLTTSGIVTFKLLTRRFKFSEKMEKSAATSFDTDLQNLDSVSGSYLQSAHAGGDDNIDALQLFSTKDAWIARLTQQLEEEKSNVLQLQKTLDRCLKDKQHQSCEQSLKKDKTPVKSDALYYGTNIEVNNCDDFQTKHDANHLPHVQFNSELWWIYVASSTALVFIGAIMSGLQVGLFSLDPMKLALLRTDSEADPHDKARARALAPLLERHHWLLVTLLIVNAAAMEALPLILDTMVPSYAAILLSVTLVLFFGEIIPQALCVRSPLAIGAAFAPFVKLLMIIVSPVAYPLSLLLDMILGDEGGLFLLKKSELNALVDLHAEAVGGHLHTAQIKIMKGALMFCDKEVLDIMTPIDSVYMLELHRQLDFDTMHEIFNSGFSRIPIYDKTRSHNGHGPEIISILFAKDLLLLDPNDCTCIQTILSLYPRPLEVVTPETTLRDVLNIFQTTRQHMAIVRRTISELSVDETLGIVTLEDVVEAILQTEIEDETDETNAENRYRFATTFLRAQTPLAILTPQEMSAVFYTLIGNQTIFRGPQRQISDNGIKQLIANGQILGIRIDNRSDTAEMNATDVMQGGRLLYDRGQPSQWMTLLLDGSAEIRVGIEEYLAQANRWMVIGASALVIANNDLFLRPKLSFSDIPLYEPDFTAVLTESSRLLRINRIDFFNKYRAEHGLKPIIVDINMVNGPENIAASGSNLNSDPKIDYASIVDDIHYRTSNLTNVNSAAMKPLHSSSSPRTSLYESLQQPISSSSTMSAQLVRASSLSQKMSHPSSTQTLVNRSSNGVVDIRCNGDKQISKKILTKYILNRNSQKKITFGDDDTLSMKTRDNVDTGT